MATILRLSLPNIALVGAQAAVNVAETYFVGRLGTDALAGVTLAFPIVMLMQMMSAGAMGGGISSAIARALGAHRQTDANALAWHAVLIALALGASFTLLALVFGPSLYSTLGGHDASLANALEYSNIVFGGAVIVWLMNSLASVLRGSGDMRTPAVVTVAGALIMILVSPLLIFGAGTVPGLGLRGAALALLAYYFVGCVILGWRIARGSTLVSLQLCRPAWRYFAEILKVGVLIIAAGCALVTRAFGFELGGLFAVSAAALLMFGAMYALGVWRYFSQAEPALR